MTPRDPETQKAEILRALEVLRDELHLNGEAATILSERRDKLILEGRELDRRMTAETSSKPGSFLSVYAMARAVGQTNQALWFRFEKLDKDASPENS